MKKTKSIVTKYDNICVICGRSCTSEHHLLFGNRDRELAEEDGVKIPVCDYCHTFNEVKRRIHDNPMAESLSKIAGQLAYEKHKVAEGSTEDEAREMFRRRYGGSHL